MIGEHRFTVILEPLEEGGFNVLVPGVPEVATFAEMEAEALTMAEDAIRLAISYRLDHGEELPKASRSEVRQITVPV
jgi:predicted RNase H-like HicB family nuclease